ncbi:tyrosine-type recombinase/integrase [Streptomyces platensis]
MDSRDGSITLADYIDYIAIHWAPGRGGVPKTRDNQERRVRLHIVPHLGELALRNITAADLRAYIAKLEASVSSVDYRRGIRSELSSILEAAVDDKRLARNPMDAKSVRWPKAPQERCEAWLLETALRVRDAISPRNRIAVIVGLGCGLRQGEVFGLSRRTSTTREVSSTSAAKFRRSGEGCTSPCRREPRPAPSTCPFGGR